MKNAGKIFEDDFQKSVPDFCFLYRLKDQAQSFNRTAMRFSLKNPFDYFLFDTDKRILYGLELKSTCGKSMSFESIDNDGKQNGMIHKHQIIGLAQINEYKNIIGAFILNFRNNDGSQKSYYIAINRFLDLYNQTQKKSLNENDLMEYGAIEIAGNKKRTRYFWDIEKLLGMKEVFNNA